MGQVIFYDFQARRMTAREQFMAAADRLDAEAARQDQRTRKALARLAQSYRDRANG
jgi:hypothetical protein